MANLLSFPFRLTANHAIATADELTDGYLSERLAIIVNLEPGEQPLAPAFGMQDPAFYGVSLAALQVQLDAFGLPIEILDFEQKPRNEFTTTCTITFDQRGTLA